MKTENSKLKPIPLRHLSEAEILADLDGTLSPEFRLLAAVHLRTCYVCNSRKEWLEGQRREFFAGSGEEVGERGETGSVELGGGGSGADLGTLIHVDFRSAVGARSDLTWAMAAAGGEAGTVREPVVVRLEGQGLEVKLVEMSPGVCRLVLTGDPGARIPKVIGFRMGAVNGKVEMKPSPTNSSVQVGWADLPVGLKAVAEAVKKDGMELEVD